MYKKIVKNTSYTIEYFVLIIAIFAVWSLLENTGRLHPVILPSISTIIDTAV